MDKYYFNGHPINMSSPRKNGFRAGESWIKYFSDESDRACFENEKEMLKNVSGCRGCVIAEQSGEVTIVDKDGSISFDAIREGYVGDKNIRDYCEKYYEEHELLTVFIRLAEALSEIEDAGVMHNDIKPENILMNENNEPVLIDFNIAKKITGEVLPLHLKLTDGFCAPEKKEGIITIQSDIYSFGCVLDACMWQNPKYPSAFSESLRAIQNKCCCMDPALRYSSFHDVTEALSGIGLQAQAEIVPDRISWQRLYGRVIRFVKEHLYPIMTILLYGCGLFFLLLAIYMIVWGPQVPEDFKPSLKEDVHFVITDLKNRINR